MHTLDPARTSDLLTSALWIIWGSGIPYSHMVFSALIPVVRDVFPDGWEEWAKKRGKSHCERLPGLPRPLHMRNGWS